LALAGSTHAQTKKPNILVIMGDDIGVVQPQLRPASFNVDEVMRKLAPKD
jgi:arylsulfatase A-like enzyme